MKTHSLWLAASALALLSLNAAGAVLYVDAGSTNPVLPYQSWATAATNIQSAVNVCNPNDTVLVTNGVYPYVRYAPLAPLWCLYLNTSNVTVQSVNGPAVTIIPGTQQVQTVFGPVSIGCVAMRKPATLSGFTLTNGTPATTNITQNLRDTFGGGVYCASTNCIVTNCVIVGCSVGAGGGGAYGCTLVNCALIGNSTPGDGGGALNCTLNNCLLTGNSAAHGGAVASTDVAPVMVNNCTIYGNSASGWGGGLAGDDFVAVSSIYATNCIVFGNSSPSGPNYINYYGGQVTLNYCCTEPLPPVGLGNISSDPLLVNAAVGDFHLQPTSPCINSGNNGYVSVATDLDGNPRVLGGTVDMGAYEYQSPTSLISYAWLAQYGLATDGSADFTDEDGTGMSNYEKWIAGLNPTNALSVLAMFPPVPTKTPPGLIVSWQSVSDRIYSVQRSTNAGIVPAFSTIQGNIPGRPGTNSFTDTNAAGNGAFFYRVGVQR